MKKFLLFAIVVLFTIQPLLSQTKPKPKQKETVPTQKEMEELMKEAQKQMDKLDPETKKMMDSMGMKIPSFNNIPKVTDAQLQEAYENENGFNVVWQNNSPEVANVACIWESRQFATA